MNADLERTPAEQTVAPVESAVPGWSVKGYTADPGPSPAVPEEGSLPLAEVSDPPPPIHVPERDDGVIPTGRDEPGEFTPNDRLMGADR